MTENLDPTTLLAKLPSLLPGKKQLASSTDAVAVLIHTIFTSLSFVLVGLDDDDGAIGKFEGNVLPEDAVPRLDSTYIQEVEAEKDAHIGVKAVEAAEKVYGRYSKWFLFLGYGF